MTVVSPEQLAAREKAKKIAAAKAAKEAKAAAPAATTPPFKKLRRSKFPIGSLLRSRRAAHGAGNTSRNGHPHRVLAKKTEGTYTRIPRFVCRPMVLKKRNPW